LGDISQRTVLEIGPGRGVLTDRLVEKAKRVIAVELDTFLAGHLTQRYAHLSHVQIVHADVLKVSLAELAGDDFVLVGNVPYYITTPILFHALERPRPSVAVYLVQREVADRMAAPPGSKTYGAVERECAGGRECAAGETRAAWCVSSTTAVDSAVVRIIPRNDPVIEQSQEERFRLFVQNAFSFRRKQMVRVLRNVLNVNAEVANEIVAACGIAPDLRPEVLVTERLRETRRNHSGAQTRRITPGARGRTISMRTQALVLRVRGRLWRG
jgi:16S rRNA (adenine1518-N6/adenine1519-N6)-dimethyltransferase